jgi:hypothetical protein
MKKLFWWLNVQPKAVRGATAGQKSKNSKVKSKKASPGRVAI